MFKIWLCLSFFGHKKRPHLNSRHSPCWVWTPPVALQCLSGSTITHGTSSQPLLEHRSVGINQASEHVAPDTILKHKTAVSRRFLTLECNTPPGISVNQGLLWKPPQWVRQKAQLNTTRGTALPASHKLQTQQSAHRASTACSRQFQRSSGLTCCPLQWILTFLSSRGKRRRSQRAEMPSSLRHTQFLSLCSPQYSNYSYPGFLLPQSQLMLDMNMYNWTHH